MEEWKDTYCTKANHQNYGMYYVVFHV